MAADELFPVFDLDAPDLWGAPDKADSGTEVPKTASGDKRPHRRNSAIYELSAKYEYRRAFSETKLLDLCRTFDFKQGTVYNFITGGDIDSLSFLKAVLRQQDLTHLLASTWCMAGEDILQLREWIEQGKIKHLDLYLGEIFPNSYRVEWQMIRELYRDYPELGRFCVFKNHSKIFAGLGGAFAFGIQSSANINTNPRTEQASITIDNGIYDFYKAYFDGINSFE